MPANTDRNLKLHLCACIAGALFAAQPAPADTGKFPERPLRMIVPLAPGGGSDIVARMVAAPLSDRWGQPVVVDNRPGAGSTVGTGLAAKAAPDGYTVMVSSSSMAISPALHPKLDFDMRRDFAPVTLLASQPSVLAVHPSVKAQNVRELVALAKAQPGKLAYGSAGVGSATHLGSELFRVNAQLDLLHVPYKSAGLATAAAISGEVQILLTNMASALPQVKAGRLRGLGVTSSKRSSLAPAMPTVAEAGVPGFEYATWYGMVVPAATPAALVAQLHAGTLAVLNTPAMRERMQGQGLEIHGTSRQEFGKYLSAELSRWQQVVKAAGIEPQ